MKQIRRIDLVHIRYVNKTTLCVYRTTLDVKDKPCYPITPAPRNGSTSAKTGKARSSQKDQRGNVLGSVLERRGHRVDQAICKEVRESPGKATGQMPYPRLRRNTLRRVQRKRERLQGAAPVLCETADRRRRPYHVREPRAERPHILLQPGLLLDVRSRHGVLPVQREGQLPGTLDPVNLDGVLQGAGEAELNTEIRPEPVVSL